MITKWLFDVDGVLCNTSEKIDPDFHDWFVDWGKDKEYYIVTGGERSSTVNQIGLEILNNAKIQFHCMGNQIFIEGREYKINQFTLNVDELYWLNSYIQESPYHTKTGNHIEQRTGSLNISVVGRNATPDERNAYIEWDNKYGERKLLAKAFVNQFPRFDSYLGGNTSIDICLKGANKAACLNLIDLRPMDAFFFGDKCTPGGIDFPLVRILKNRCYQVTNGYKDTWEKLKSL